MGVGDHGAHFRSVGAGLCKQAELSWSSQAERSNICAGFPVRGPGWAETSNTARNKQLSLSQAIRLLPAPGGSLV